MKRYWSGLAVAGMLAATAALGAQSQNPANTPPPDSAAQPGSQREQTSPPAQSRTPNTVTVTGCIQNAPAASASGAANQGRSAPGAAAGSQSEQRFVLNNARMASGAAGRSAVGTTGTAATRYQLDGQTTEISKHLNHQVEITGMVQSSAASAPGSARAAEGSTAAGPTLRVTSVRMLSAMCETAATPGTSGSRPGAPGDSDAPGGQTSPGGRPSPGNPADVPPQPRPNEGRP